MINVIKFPFSMGEDKWIATGIRIDDTVTWRMIDEETFIKNKIKGMIDLDDAIIVADVTDDYDINVTKAPTENMGKMMIRIMLTEIMTRATSELAKLQEDMKEMIEQQKVKNHTIVGEA